MIRLDLVYALRAMKPLAIDPLRVQAFLHNADTVLSNPDLAHLLSKYADSNRRVKKSMGKNANFDYHADFADDDEDEKCFKPQSFPYVQDGIGIIPVDGVIGKGLSPLETMLGCVDIDIISKTLDSWKDRADIYEVVFNFDTGGGTTTGLQELAKKIRNYTKPTIAFTETNCGSAGYWLASQCNRVVCTPSAELGAVGIYITICDESEKYAEEGKRVVIIRSGDYKGAGISGTSLTDKQLKNLNEEVVELHRRFINDVKSTRLFASDEDLQGQTFYGDIAVQRGLATANVDSFKELIEGIKTLRNTIQTSLMPSVYRNAQ